MVGGRVAEDSNCGGGHAPRLKTGPSRVKSLVGSIFLLLQPDTDDDDDDDDDADLT